MKTNILVMSCFWVLSAYAESSIEEYARRLDELGSQVQNGSEGDMAVHAQVFNGAEALLDSSRFNCQTAMQILTPDGSGGDCLLVIRSNDTLALDTYFDEVAAGASNNAVRPSMKAILREMDTVQVYVIGQRSNRGDYEISTWYLLAELDGQVILLSHERVYT